MNFLVLFFFSVVLAGCSSISLQSTPENFGVSSLDTSVEFVGPNNIQINQKPYDQKIILAFPYITGGLFGMTDEKPLFLSLVDDSRRFKLDFNSQLKEIKRRSTTLNEFSKNIGITVQPEATLLGRVGTFPYDAETKQLLGAGAFMDPVTRDFVSLIYVDRACQIKGETQLEGETTSFDLMFDGGGFYWVRFVKESESKANTTRYKGPAPKFIIITNKVMSI